MSPLADESSNEKNNTTETNITIPKEDIHFPSKTAPSISKAESTNTHKNNNDTNNTTTIRTLSGKALESISKGINDHILVARYGTLVTIACLVGYSIHKSPFLFKFRSIQSIPKEYYTNRKVLVGRFVHDLNGKPNSTIPATNNSSKSIRFLFQHYSLIDRLLFRLIPRYNPTVSPDDLLKIELAGVITPPSDSITYQQTLDHIANDTMRKNVLFSSELIACKRNKYINSTTNTTTANKSLSSTFNDEEHVAISKIYYKPSIFNKRLDLSKELISSGRVMIVNDLLYLRNEQFHTTIVDHYTISPSALKQDGIYMNMLAKLEYDAFLYRRGIWVHEDTRGFRKDLILEEEEETSSMSTKIWKFIKSYSFR